MTTGVLSLMGSGELAPSMVATHRRVLETTGADRVTVLDTPFGFQENADQLTERIVDFFRTSLSVPAEVASLRGPAPEPVDVSRLLAAVRRSRYVFAGPGSPSYALRVWRGAGLVDALTDVISEGGAVVFASAAALTIGRSTLPVYEIYKVGEDPYWLEGLDLTGALGLPVTVIPHWNNAEGGNHDTSRCYVGERRLRRIQSRLDTGILGIDEHTSATVDLGAGRLEVAGVGAVTLRGSGRDRVVASGESLELEELRQALDTPAGSPVGTEPPAAQREFGEALEEGDADGAVAAVLRLEAEGADRDRVRSMIVELGQAASEGLVDRSTVVGGFVDLACELRARRREAGDYEEADWIRDRLADLGVEVRDTPEGWTWDLTDE